MYSLLRVPKKAALTALRGLIVGTSCGIALIAEDRRRRINCAQHVLRNADRIRAAAREYHTTTGGVGSSIEDERNAANNGNVVRWRKKNATRAKITSRLASTAASSQGALDEEEPGVVLGDSISTSSPTPAPTAERGDSRASREYGRVRLAWGSQLMSCSSFTPPALRARTTEFQAAPRSPHGPVKVAKPIDVLSVITRVTEARKLMDIRGLGDALTLVQKTLKHGQISPEHQRALINAVAALSVDCRKAGLTDFAGRALLYVVEHGPLVETDYYAFDPLAIVTSAIAAVESSVAEKLDNAAVLDRLHYASTLFLPRFMETGVVRSRYILEVGMKMLDLALSLDQFELAEKVYLQLLTYYDNLYRITQDFITKLCEKQEYKLAIKYFLQSYSKMQPTKESCELTAKVVTEAAVAYNNHKTGQVLRALIKVCRSRVLLWTPWVTNLLYGHWQRGQDYDATKALYYELHAEGIEELVHKPECAYRVMIQISLEAEQHDDAETLLQELILLIPSQASDARILGLFALAKAKAGEWDAVWEHFKAMTSKDRIEDVFVPVLKEFVRMHTISETEEFMRAYIDQLQVPVCRYMVNVLANQYGAIRDVTSFVGWLGYCAQAGFAVDYAFSNAILVNCKRKWDFTFEDLRTVFRKLKLLSPDYTDRFTKRVMLNAAIGATKHGHKPLTRIKSLGIKLTGVFQLSRVSTPDDVYLAMRHAMGSGEYVLVRRIYRSARRQGLPYSARCLKLAVESTLRIDSTSFKPAVIMLNEAQKTGNDITSATIPIVFAQFKNINLEMGKEEVAKAAQRIIAKLESGGLIVPTAVLNRAAALCLKAKNYSSAVSFALSAMDRRGAKRPDDTASFCLLLMAYTGLCDPNGIKWTVLSALQGDFAHKTIVLVTLKNAKALLRRLILTKEVTIAIRMIEEGVHQILKIREDLMKDRIALQRDTIMIMQQAAIGTGQAPVDFTQVPWLPDAREKRRREMKEAMLAERVHNYELWEQQQGQGGTFVAMEQAIANMALKPDEPRVSGDLCDFDSEYKPIFRKVTGRLPERQVDAPEYADNFEAQFRTAVHTK